MPMTNFYKDNPVGIAYKSLAKEIVTYNSPTQTFLSQQAVYLTFLKIMVM